MDEAGAAGEGGNARIVDIAAGVEDLNVMRDDVGVVERIPFDAERPHVQHGEQGHEDGEEEIGVEALAVGGRPEKRAGNPARTLRGPGCASRDSRVRSARV